MSAQLKRVVLAGIIWLSLGFAPAFAGEADLIVPDLSSVTFLGLTGRSLLIWCMSVCVFGFIFGLVQFLQIRGIKVQRSLTKDLSGVGLRLVTEQLLNPGTSLEVEIKLPDRGAPLTFTAEVVWSKLISEQRKSYDATTAETGIKFVNVDPKVLALIKQYAAMNAPPPQSS